MFEPQRNQPRHFSCKQRIIKKFSFITILERAAAAAREEKHQRKEVKRIIFFMTFERSLSISDRSEVCLFLSANESADRVGKVGQVKGNVMIEAGRS